MLNSAYPIYSDVSGTTPSGSSEASGGTGSSSGSYVPPTYGSAVDGSDAPPSGGSGSGSTPGTVTSHPIDKFLASQGTFCANDGMGGCGLYMGGQTANYLGWFTKSQDMLAAVDYAGVAERWMAVRGRANGTVINGSVKEEALPDGRARVSVELTGSNVAAYVVRGVDFSGALHFGSRPAGRANTEGKPALGHVTMRIVFFNTHVGAPLPDLMQLLRSPQPGQALESIWMDYNGDGFLYPSGEPRHLQVTYDGSGAIYPYSPSSPEKTPVMGTASIQGVEAPAFVVAPD